MPLKTVPGLPDDQYNARWIARLMQRVRPGENGCIEVDGFHNADGYANAYHRKWGDFPHRVLMILIHGPMAPGLMACHKCGNHGCVNPDHLYIGTMKQNARDTVNMGRHLEANKTACIHGHPFDDVNTWVCKNGKRHCRTCARIINRKRAGWPPELWDLPPQPLGRRPEPIARNWHSSERTRRSRARKAENEVSS